MINNPLIRPAISWGGAGIGGVPLDSHEYPWKNGIDIDIMYAIPPNKNRTQKIVGFFCWG